MKSHDMLHEVKMKGSPKKVFDSITTKEGLKGWWTSDIDSNNGILNFYFYKRSGMFRMAIDRVIKNKLVEWTCLGADKEWKGTKIVFEIEHEKNYSILRFTHSGWNSISGYFRRCNTTWGHLMIVLKDYVEGKNPGPYFK